MSALTNCSVWLMKLADGWAEQADITCSGSTAPLLILSNIVLTVGIVLFIESGMWIQIAVAQKRHVSMKGGIKRVFMAGLVSAIPIGLKIVLQVLIGSVNFFRYV